MKKLIIALAMMMATGTAAMADKPLHRHNKQAVTMTATADSVGITAYSDTTSYNNVAAADSSDFDEDMDSPFTDSFSDVNDPIQLIAFLADKGAIGGILVAIIVLVVGLLILVAPFILIGWLVYYALRSRRQKYQVIEKAIESGQPLPKEMLGGGVMTKSYTLQNGIKKASIGVGIAVLCYCLGADELAGIGWLVFFYGVGQVAISYFTKDKEKSDDEADAEEVEE